MRSLTLVFFSLLNAQSYAASINPMNEIKKTIQFYRDAAAVQAEVEKKVTLALLDETKISQGSLLYSKGQLKLLMKGAEDSLLILNKSSIWVVNEIMVNDEKKIQALKIVKSKNIYSKAPLALLLSSPSAWDQFKITNHNDSGDVLEVKLQPKKSGQFGDIQKVSITINKKLKQLIFLSYADEIENKTDFKFNSINFKTKIDKKQFQYTPPVGAEITEY